MQLLASLRLLLKKKGIMVVSLADLVHFQGYSAFPASVTLQGDLQFLAILFVRHVKRAVGLQSYKCSDSAPAFPFTPFIRWLANGTSSRHEYLTNQ